MPHTITYNILGYKYSRYITLEGYYYSDISYYIYQYKFIDFLDMCRKEVFYKERHLSTFQIL